jgi:hypothetical protein
MSKDYLNWYHHRIVLALFKRPTETKDLVKHLFGSLCSNIGAVERMHNIHIGVIMHGHSKAFAAHPRKDLLDICSFWYFYEQALTLTAAAYTKD